MADGDKQSAESRGSQTSTAPDRGRRELAVVVLVAAAVVSACATRSTLSGSAGACAALHPDTVSAQRSVSLSGNGFRPLNITKHDARLATALLNDFCVTEDHHANIPGSVNCPADFGLHYAGAFAARGRTLATFEWYASGCQKLTLRIVHGPTESTYLFAAAATAAPDLDSDFQQVLGLRCEQDIFEPPGGGC